jgi:hypothetical protein
MQPMNNLLESKVVRTVIWVLGGLIVIFLAFGLGVRVGEGRVGFAKGLDANYFQDFPGIVVRGGQVSVAVPANIRASGMMPVPVVVHGLAGTVLAVAPPIIAVQDGQNNEQSVMVATGTIIREYDGTIMVSGITVGDQVAVIGSPNADGQVVARFIRVFPASSSSFPAQ